MAEQWKTIRVIQREYRIFNWRGKAYSPTPLLYTTDEALCSTRGTLDGLNASLLELALIPALLPIPTLPLTPTLPPTPTLPLTPTLPPIPPPLWQAPLRQAPSWQALTITIPPPVSAVD
jgi:hypothetical protein